MAYFGIIFMTVYGGANVYIAIRLFQWLRILFPGMNGAVYICIYVLIAVTLVVGFLPAPSGIKSAANLIGSYWMGVYIYLLIFLVAADVLVFAGRLAKLIPYPAPRVVLVYKTPIALLLTIVVIGYGLLNAAHIRHASYELRLGEKAPPGALNIVLISDLHLGAINSERNLARVVREINSLTPDVVCIAGDIFNGDINSLSDPSGTMELLKSIETRYGVYASPGNHDAGNTFSQMIDFLTRSNITLLCDDSVIIDGRVLLVGRIDPSPIGGFGGRRRSEISEVLPQTYTDLPVVVMDHNPSGIGQYGSETDLILSGHTHRGQLFPANLITRAMFTVHYGHYQKNADSPHVIVTSGAGVWGPPMRVGSSNEVVSITLI